MIYIVSPMLKDTVSFLRLRTEVTAAIQATGDQRVVRFVVIDDSAGTDAEVQHVRDLPNVSVLTPPFNLGHQRAIVYGLRHLTNSLADDDVVVTMDSDGEDQPGDVPRLLAALADTGAALVLAERTTRSETLLFRLFYVMFRVFFRLMAGITVLSGNFAAQRADSLKVTIYHPSFDLCYSSTLLALRRPSTTVPCARGKRFAGRSRMSTSSLIVHGIRMLLPFAERITARMLVAAATTFTMLATLVVLTLSGALDTPVGSIAFALLLFAGAAFSISFVCFFVLFSGLRQSAPVAVKGIGG